MLIDRQISLLAWKQPSPQGHTVCMNLELLTLIVTEHLSQGCEPFPLQRVSYTQEGSLDFKGDYGIAPFESWVKEFCWGFQRAMQCWTFDRHARKDWRKLQFIIKSYGKVIWGADQNSKWEDKEWIHQGVHVLLRFSFDSHCFYLVFCDIYLLPDELSADLSGSAEWKKNLAIQVYIESRWLNFFLEWFMSAPTLRGQSKQKATLSNLLHPGLRHSCPNGSRLLRMTMNRALARTVCSALYWSQTCGRGVPVTKFHLKE